MQKFCLNFWISFKVKSLLTFFFTCVFKTSSLGYMMDPESTWKSFCWWCSMKQFDDIHHSQLTAKSPLPSAWVEIRSCLQTSLASPYEPFLKLYPCALWNLWFFFFLPMLPHAWTFVYMKFLYLDSFFQFKKIISTQKWWLKFVINIINN